MSMQSKRSIWIPYWSKGRLEKEVLAIQAKNPKIVSKTINWHQNISNKKKKIKKPYHDKAGPPRTSKVINP